jgi:hypothetical protein
MAVCRTVPDYERKQRYPVKSRYPAACRSDRKSPVAFVSNLPLSAGTGALFFLGQEGIESPLPAGRGVGEVHNCSGYDSLLFYSVTIIYHSVLIRSQADTGTILFWYRYPI